MHPTYDRRTFLRRAGLTGAGAAALALGAARPPAYADEELGAFVHGVASGDPMADRVVIWTRFTPPEGDSRAAAAVQWTVARDLELTDVVARGTERATPERDWTVKVDVDGLEPGTWYYYGFQAAGERSITGRTRTAPSGGVERLRFGVVSCANYPAGYFNAYARLAERDDLDAILHLGDYLYEYGNGEYGSAREVDPPHEMARLGDYRRRHAHYKLDPDLRRLHQLFPMIAIWDDHESTNDSWSGGAENHNPDDPDTEGEAGLDWNVRKAEAQAVYSEWMPIRTDDPARIYRTLRYGDLVDLFLLDTRLEGRDEQVGETLDPTLFETATDDPERQLISETQRTWLYDQLSTSTARWKIVGQQVMMGQLNAGGLPRLPEQYPDSPRFFRDGGNALNPDQWDGYQAERDRLYAHVREQDVSNLVVLTGDIHTSWAIDLTEDPYDPSRYNPVTGEGALGVEFVTPSVTSDNFDEILGKPSDDLEAAVKVGNPHIKYADLDEHGYFVLDITPDKVQADFWFVDTLSEPSDGESFGAAWLVRDGAGHVEEADGPTEPREGAAQAPPADPPASPGAGAGTADGTDTAAGGSTEQAGEVTAAASAAPLPVTGGGSVLGGAALLGAAGLLRIRGRGRSARL